MADRANAGEARSASMAELSSLPFITLELPALEWLHHHHELRQSPLGTASPLGFILDQPSRSSSQQRAEAGARLSSQGLLDPHSSPSHLRQPHRAALELLASASRRLAVTLLVDGASNRLHFFGRKGQWVAASVDPQGFHLAPALHAEQLAAAIAAMGASRPAAMPEPPAPGTEILLVAEELVALGRFATAADGTGYLSEAELSEALQVVVKDPAAVIRQLREAEVLRKTRQGLRVGKPLLPWLGVFSGPALGLELLRATKKGPVVSGLDVIGPPGARCRLFMGQAREGQDGRSPGTRLLRLSDGDTEGAVLELIDESRSPRA